MSEPPIEDFSAELLILEDMGVDAKKLDRINSKAAAEKLIQYYNAKNTPEKEETKNDPKEESKINLKPNMGFQGLPPPEEITEELKLNLMDKMNPLSVNKANKNRYIANSRLCVVFTDEHPEGMVF